MSHPAFTPQPQSITALWPVLIFRPAEGRRLSWGCRFAMSICSRTMRHRVFRSYTIAVLNTLKISGRELLYTNIILMGNWRLNAAGIGLSLRCCFRSVVMRCGQLFVLWTAVYSLRSVVNTVCIDARRYYSHILSAPRLKAYTTADAERENRSSHQCANIWKVYLLTVYSIRWRADMNYALRYT